MSVRFVTSAALLWCAITLLQWRGNAFRAEFGDNADEPAHYVTGLMVRDYAAQGFPARPLEFARNYYLHYPKVSLGHWPPFFYIVQAAWTLTFSPGRASLMLLMGAITALLAALVGEMLQGEIDWPLRYGAGAIFISLPWIARFSRALMAEMLVALLVFLAVIAFGRYLDTERWQPAAWFGLACALAILTKGSAIQLALVPPLAVLLSRRPRLFVRFTFWMPALIVAAIAGPWYLLVPGAQHESIARFGGVAFDHARLVTSLEFWYQMLGWPLAAASVLGIWLCSTQKKGIWPSSLAVILGAYLSRSLIEAYEARHLLVNLPYFLLFAMAGGQFLLRWTGRKLMLAAIMAFIAFNLYQVAPKHYYGYSAVAETLLARPDLTHSAILVCSSAEGEGMLISEVAMREARPGHLVLRASKMLASSDWMGAGYHPLFRDVTGTLAWVESVPAGVVVIDEAGQATPHGKLLFEGIKAQPEWWEQLPSGSSNILLFRLIGQETRKIQSIRIPVSNGLYGTFSN